jgi:hypothetical protein
MSEPKHRRTLIDQPTPRPTDKVTAATAAVAATAIVVWVVEYATGIDIPSLVEGAVATVAVFGAGYLKRDSIPS